MEAIRRYLKVQLPRYLKGLPLPRTFAGFLKLKQEEWMYLMPLLVTIAVLFYSLFFSGKSDSKSAKAFRVNRQVKLEKEKVVDFLDVPEVEDLVNKGKGKCLVCRCWKSKKFPLCDGSHVKHNKETGDNVGPLVIQEKK
uniref:Iron-binding zinc finger CDGSH type domain-containing protein n=1 Tax=Globisporangium ultimum (strain ATCC 200006 / CBS 805.95 / DAOM BR144) TaxID=431595 RepID=K3WAJ6_GLOUD